MFTRPLTALSALVGVFALSLTANAGVKTFQTFDEDPPLAESDAPGVWSVDRFAPRVFESQEFMGDNRLLLGINGNDLQDNQFRNTQGRKFLTTGARQMSIDFFVDPDFGGVEERIGGFWATAADTAGTTTFFPIIEFFDDQFWVFDSLGELGDPQFLSVGTLDDFNADFGEFVNLAFGLSGDNIDFSINGMSAMSLNGGGTEQFANVILQGVNTGTDRSLFFDNLQAVPVPASLGLFGMGLIGLGGIAVRRRRRAA